MAGALTIVDPSGIEFSSMARVRKNDPVCLIGLRLHILDHGSTFNLHTRVARQRRCARRCGWKAERWKRGRTRQRGSSALRPHGEARDRSLAMRILDKAVYVGPSLYAHFPVIRLDIDLGELEEWPSGKLGRGFTDGLLAALPGLHEHGCSYGKPGGFVRRLTEDDGTWMGHILEHVAIELQNVAGEPVTFGKTRSHGEPGHYHVVYQYEQEDVGLEAGPARPHAPAFAASAGRCARRGRCRRTSTSPRSGTSSSASPSAGTSAPAPCRWCGRRRSGEIPWIRLNEQSLIQFGHGRYQQRIQATVTSRTSHIAVELASDKEETNRILGNLGLPVPQQRLVQGGGRRGRGGGAHRLPGGGQAVQRQPRPRHLDPPHLLTRRCARRSRWPGSTAGASSSRASSPARTTGCW